MSTLNLKNVTLNADFPVDTKDGKNPSEFTVYVEADKLREQLRLDKEYSIAGKSFDFQGAVDIGGRKFDWVRGHAALCFGEKLFSLTVREKGGSKVIQPTARRLWSDPKRPYPSNTVLYKALTAPEGKRITGKGLVLIAGATGSGKTECLDDFLRYQLTARLEDDNGKEVERLPHIVAIGDPVETLFFGKSLEESCMEVQTKGRPFDFTPRVLGRDVVSVEDALKDALRETPAAVVVSELRDDKDFVAALDFAATGHLILATCHSTSLTEVFARLLEVSRTPQSASERAALINRIVAVVHIKKLEGGPYAPTLWRPSARGRQDFISEGLSSIIPASPIETRSENERGVLGRYWMVKQQGVDDTAQQRKAFAMDLRGE